MKKCILASSLLALLIGCSQNGGSSGRVNPAALADTGTQADLMGNWSQACQAGAFSGGGFAATNGPAASVSSSLTGIGSSQNFLDISENQMKMITRGFMANDCTGTAAAESQVNFDYQIANYMPNQNNNADLTMRSATMRLHSQEAANAANAAHFCGLSGWQVEVSRNIAGTSCLQNMPASTGRSIFQTLNYQNGNLAFGVLDENAASTSSSRPTALGTIPFTRVAGATDNSGNGGASSGSTGGSQSGSQDKGQSQDQNQDQSKDQSMDKGQDQSGQQGQDKSQDKGQDKSMDKGQDQSGQQGQDKGQDKGGQQGQDKGGQQGQDKGQDKGGQQGQDKSQDKGQDKGGQQGQDKGQDQSKDQSGQGQSGQQGTPTQP